MEVLERFTLYDDETDDLFESGDNVDIVFDSNGTEKSMIDVLISGITKEKVDFIDNNSCNFSIPIRQIVSMKMNDVNPW